MDQEQNHVQKLVPSSVPSPKDHACDLNELDYKYREHRQLYRIVCRVCGRNWNLTIRRDYFRQDKMIGVWYINPFLPGMRAPNFQNKAQWARLTANNAPQIRTPEDDAWELEAQARREIRKLSDEMAEARRAIFSGKAMKQFDPAKFEPRTIT